MQRRCRQISPGEPHARENAVSDGSYPTFRGAGLEIRPTVSFLKGRNSAIARESQLRGLCRVGVKWRATQNKTANSYVIEIAV
jgi:hypothetical protein